MQGLVFITSAMRQRLLLGVGTLGQKKVAKNIIVSLTFCELDAIMRRKTLSLRQYCEPTFMSYCCVLTMPAFCSVMSKSPLKSAILEVQT